MKPVNCKHWSECGVAGGGCCAAGKYGGRPSYGVCDVCMGVPIRGVPLTVEGVPSSRGLGDTIAKVTTALGIKPCGGCKKRQAALNNLVPYRPTPP